MPHPTLILGSRSPRRRELLALLAASERIVVRPPRCADEAGFAGLANRAAISARLLDIVDAKRRDVVGQLTPAERTDSVGIVADTIIVAAESEGTPIVLGQPPETDWEKTVREWFQRYYADRTHEAWTGLCIWRGDRILAKEIVTTAVTFGPMSPEEIEWYLSTDESRGKAGGYALQGLASVFVRRIEGSWTNVVGLPLEAVRRALAANSQA